MASDVAEVEVAVGVERCDDGASTGVGGDADWVDHFEQRRDVGDLRQAGKDQRQGARDIGDGAQVPLADRLDVEAILDAVGVGDHADHRLSHANSPAPRDPSGSSIRLMAGTILLRSCPARQEAVADAVGDSAENAAV